MEGCDCNNKISEDSCGKSDLKEGCSDIDYLPEMNLTLF
jgi:hypothetical protein